MDTIKVEFERELKALLDNYEKPRPFICNGHPLECDVFVVGINAATEMKKSFWDFWTCHDVREGVFGLLSFFD